MTQTALVTGSSRGLGLGLCRGLLAKGWQVLASARNPAASGIAALQAEFGERCRPMALNVSEDRSVANCCTEIAETGITLDLLVHNAGIFAEGEEGIQTLDRARMLQVMNTNVIAPLILTRALLPSLRQPGSKVVALTSAQWGQPPDSRPGSQYSYGISKQALWMALHCLRSDLEPLGITVEGLGPGFVRTDMTSGSPVTPPLSVEESVANMLAKLLPHA